MVGSIFPPNIQDNPVRFPEICEYVTLNGKRDFAAVVKLRILNGGDYPGLCRWAQSNNEGP